MRTSNASMRIRSVAIGVFAVSIICAALSVVTAKADFFDELFGPEQRAAAPSPGYYSPHPGPHRQIWRVKTLRVAPQVHHHESPRKPRVAYSRHDVSDHYQTATGSTPVKPAFCSREPPAKMSGFNQLLHDSTLRSGDIVAMTTGLRIFHGGGACPHKERDFVAIGGGGFGRGRLRMLAGLEVAHPSHGGDPRR